MDGNKLLRETETAEFLGVSRAYLRRMRCDGAREERAAPIPFLKMGRAVRYRYGDLVQWQDAHRVVAL